MRVWSLLRFTHFLKFIFVREYIEAKLLTLTVDKSLCQLCYLNNPIITMKNQAPVKNISKKQFNLQPAGQNIHDTIYSNIINPSSRVQCNFCKRDITKSTKIYVKLLEKQEQYLCISCFSNQTEPIEYYHVINKLSFPMYEHHWSAYEQLLLLEGLQKHGFANWLDICDFLGRIKSPDELQEHYHLVYVKNSNFLPNENILVKRNEENILVQTGIQIHPKRPIKPFRPKQATQSQGNKPKGAGTTTQKVSTNPIEIVGFVKQRGDFEIQYDNDAELLLAQMEFNQDDTQEEKAMKFRLMDIYNHKLIQRYKRKDFVIARRVLDIREQMRLDKTRTKDQKEIYNLMKVFARFNNPEDHDKIVQGLIKEKQLRQRIAQLKELKAKGLKTLGEIEDQLDNKKKKDEKSKRGQTDLFNPEKSKTRRVRKDPMVEKSEKRVLYINSYQEQLCKRLNMTFKQYMAMKQIILRESVRQGIISKNEITGMLQVKRQISEAVYDFVVQQQNLMEIQNPPNESLQ